MTEAGPKRNFNSHPTVYFYIAFAETRTEEGKRHLYVVIDRASKPALARLEARAARAIACQFLRDLIEHVPYQIHTVLTHNGAQFCHPPRQGAGPRARYVSHLFNRICAEHGVEHCRIKPNHP